MQASASLADFDGLHDVRMANALAVASFTNEARDRSLILAKLFTQDFHGDNAVGGMFGAEDRRRTSLADLAAEGVSGDRLTDQVLFGHGRT
jgi:hypothetical protein